MSWQCWRGRAFPARDEDQHHQLQDVWQNYAAGCGERYRWATLLSLRAVAQFPRCACARADCPVRKVVRRLMPGLYERQMSHEWDRPKCAGLQWLFAPAVRCVLCHPFLGRYKNFLPSACRSSLMTKSLRHGGRWHTAVPVRPYRDNQLGCFDRGLPADGRPALGKACRESSYRDGMLISARPGFLR